MMSTEKDLFEYPNEIPKEVSALFGDHEPEREYKELKVLLIECEKLGYTFDYYLDGVPYNLRQIN